MTGLPVKYNASVMAYYVSRPAKIMTLDRPGETSPPGLLAEKPEI